MENVLDSYDINDSEQVNQYRLMLSRISRNLRWFMSQKDVNSVDLHKQLGVSTGTISGQWGGLAPTAHRTVRTDPYTAPHVKHTSMLS